MSTKVNVLVTGITGYIGGAVVDRILARPDASSFDIRAIVRSADKCEKLKAFGITPIVGSHNDEGVMVKAASEVDVVIAMADADDPVAAKVTLKDCKKRFEGTGKPPVFIHTSGTGVLADNAAGKYVTDTIYNDADADQIETLPATQIHRNVDLEILGADKEGYVKSYIIIPSTIYSIAKGPLFEAGISNPHPIQVPALIRASLDRKQAAMVGDGANVWPNVDIYELADLYNILYDSIVKKPDQTGHGREGIYFGANDEYRLYDVGRAIGEALVDLGISQNPEPTTFSQQEIDKYFGGSSYVGSNSRCVANRSKSIGWNPKKTTSDLLKSIKAETEAWIKKDASPVSEKLSVSTRNVQSSIPR
ncbi:NAD(P)-binding protein [Marasmius fiardii PR-910]|nr:NAD(P)-binding protein [Marasmius fiardii PR-910]